MRRIIKGKLYNTETAKAVGDWWNGCGRNDFHFCEETLYKKTTGEFFIHGRGGAASPYTKAIGQNCWCGDSAIVPLTLDEAKAWAEKHLDADEYIEIFGEVEE